VGKLNIFFSRKDAEAQRKREGDNETDGFRSPTSLNDLHYLQKI